MSPEKRNAILAVTTATTLALGLAACGGGSGTETKAAVRVNLADVNVDNLCENATPWTADQYVGKVGANLSEPIGSSVGNGMFKFNSRNGQSATEIANQNLVESAPQNTALLATMNTILSSEQGITVSQVQTQANAEMGNMLKNKSYRDGVCENVIHRILDNGFVRLWQSPADVVQYYPVYFSKSNQKFNQIGATSSPNTKKIELYGIGPQSSNDALGEAISQQWGIAANGQVVQESSTNGTYRISVNGSPFNPENTGPVTSITQQNQNPEDTSGNVVQTVKSGTVTKNASGSNSTASKSNTGNSGSGGSSPTESKGTGGAGSGAEGSTSGQSGTGTSGTGGGGGRGGGTGNTGGGGGKGGGGGETTTTTRPPETTTTRPPQTTTTTRPPQTTTTTRPPETTTTTTPPTTTTTIPPTTTTTTPPKTGGGGCDPNITKCN